MKKQKTSTSKAKPRKPKAIQEKSNTDIKEFFKAPVANDFGFDATQQSSVTSIPIVIKLTNLSDDKLYKVSVFNPEHEKQTAIKYEVLSGVDVSYNQMIHDVMANARTIGKVLNESECAFRKFQQKQTISPVALKSVDTYGIVTKLGRLFYMNAFQQQSHISKLAINPEDNWVLKSFSDMILDYLMPETTVIFRFYPRNKTSK